MENKKNQIEKIDHDNFELERSIEETKDQIEKIKQDVQNSGEKIEKLKQLGKEYGQLLKKYQEYTRLTDQEIELLVNGYGKRIEIFEKIMG